MVKILKCYLIPKKSYGTLSKGVIFFGQPCITNELNNFFCNIGSKLAKDINHTSKKKPGDYLTKRIKESIF